MPESKDRILIAKWSDGWERTEIRFDREEDRFYRGGIQYDDRHGTYILPMLPQTDEAVWEALVSAACHEGAEQYLRIRGEAPELPPEEGISREEFLRGVEELRERYPVLTPEIELLPGEIRGQKWTVQWVLKQGACFWQVTVGRAVEGFRSEGGALGHLLQELNRFCENHQCIHLDWVREPDPGEIVYYPEEDRFSLEWRNV